MPSDINAILQPQVTKTATFTGAAFLLQGGTPKYGLVARVIIPTYISAGTAGTVFTPEIVHSDDGVTWTLLASGTPLVGGTTANVTAVEQYIRYFTKKPYVAARMTFSSVAGTPSITYQVDTTVTDH